MFRLLLELAPSSRWVAQAGLNIAMWVYRHPQVPRILNRHYQDSATIALRRTSAEGARTFNDNRPHAFLSHYSSVTRPSPPPRSQELSQAQPFRPPPYKAN